MCKIKDEINNRFGRLMVIKNNGFNKQGSVIWLCKCDCGNEVVIRGASLRNGATKSCGCLQKEIVCQIGLINITGQRYGRLVIIRRIGSEKHNGVATWLCKCDCGKEVCVNGTSLRSGRTKSCGCLKIDLNKLPMGEASFNRFYRGTQQNAKKRGYEWKLTKEEVKILTKKNCYYCWIESNQIICHNNNGAYLYNGLDRIDNTKGYTMDNVVPCCGTCNFAKREMSLEQLLNWVNKIHNNFPKQSVREEILFHKFE